jgi:DNA-binding Xre family transcriptional regulator
MEMIVKNRLIQLMGEKQARENRTITISLVARETKISRTALYDLVSYKSRRLDSNIVVKLCQYFGCELADFLYIDAHDLETS